MKMLRSQRSPDGPAPQQKNYWHFIFTPIKERKTNGAPIQRLLGTSCYEEKLQDIPGRAGDKKASGLDLILNKAMKLFTITSEACLNFPSSGKTKNWCCFFKPNKPSGDEIQHHTAQSACWIQWGK